MDLKLNPHLPIITPRIEFSSSSHSHPPAIITPRIDFADLWVGDNYGASHAVSSDMDSDYEMDFDADEMLFNNNEKIPKPPGEPGRPNSGGYNIEKELSAWGADKISQVTVGSGNAEFI